MNPSTHRRRGSSALQLSQVCFWCWIAFVNVPPFGLCTLYNTEFAFPEFCLKASPDCVQNQVHVPESGFPGLSDLAIAFIHPRLHWAPEPPLPALPAPLCRPPSLPAADQMVCLPSSLLKPPLTGLVHLTPTSLSSELGSAFPSWSSEEFTPVPRGFTYLPPPHPLSSE